MSTIGVGSVLGIATEPTLGVFEATNDWLAVRSCTLTRLEQWQRPGHLLPGGAAAGNAVQRDQSLVAREIGGGITFVPKFDARSFTALLKHLLHSSTTPSGSGPYTHAYEVGTTMSGLSVQAVAGLSEAVTDKTRRFTGLCCTSWELKAEPGGFVEISSDWIGVSGSELQALSGVVALPASEEITAAHFDAASTPWNALAMYLRSLSVKVDYKLARTPFLGSLTTAKPARSDFTEITIAARVQVRSSAIHDAYLAGDQADMTMTFTGTAPNELEIVAHNARLTKCDLALDAPGELLYDCEWTASAGTGKAGLAVTVTNDNATAES